MDLLKKEQAYLIKDISVVVKDVLQNLENPANEETDQASGIEECQHKDLLQSISLHYYTVQREDLRKKEHGTDDTEHLPDIFNDWMNLSEEEKMELTSHVVASKLNSSKKMKKMGKLLVKTLNSLKSNHQILKKQDFIEAVCEEKEHMEAKAEHQNQESIQIQQNKEPIPESVHESSNKVHQNEKEASIASGLKNHKEANEAHNEAPCEESKDDRYSIIANASVGQIQESFVMENKSNKCQSEVVCDFDADIRSAEKQRSEKGSDMKLIQAKQHEVFSEPKKVLSNHEAAQQQANKPSPCTPEKIAQ